MTIARRFTILAVVPFLLVLGFAGILTAQLAGLSREGARLVEHYRQTAALNQELTRDDNEEIETLQRQLARPDAALAERSRQLTYDITRKYTAYLSLDIDDRERLMVERIRALQSELSLLSMQIYEQMRAGRSDSVSARVAELYQLHDQIRRELAALGDVQVEKLGGVLDHLNRSASRGLATVVVLLAAMVALAVMSALSLRRRILRPIGSLLEASDRVRQGDFAARASAGRADEFGQLTAGFNFMAESLAASYAELERKVEERTKALGDAQAQLIRAEKMSALGVLVSGVAHELNNPLAAIRGFVELARMEMAEGGEPVRAVGLLDEVDAQVERCRRITGDLLQFARQEPPALEPIDANAALDQVLRFREYELETHNIRLVRELDPSRPTVSADRDKLQQVFLNLLNNACDAVAENRSGGRIVVRTRSAPDRVEFEFLDDGPGFQEPARAFDPFYTTKEVGKGTGLGLSICHGIVLEHGGDIRAENWEGGARVTMWLPAAASPAVSPVAPLHPEPAPPAPVSPAASPETMVLVVDDEELLLRTQAAFLKRMGVSAATVTTGEAAIEYLRRHRVDLIVSDVRMPGSVDGVKLFEWVGEHRPELAGRFLFVSGDLLGLNLGDFFRNRGVRAIGKPFRFAEYARAIGEVLASGSREP